MDESASSWPTPLAPHCPNRDRPAWLLSKWHCAQDHEIERRYGIRCEDYWRLFERQGGRCALCGRRPGRWRLVIDHSHEPPYEVRGLLHFTCNRLLEPLTWLAARLFDYALAPPGKDLELIVPVTKVRVLEARDRDKQQRARERQVQRKRQPERRRGGGVREDIRRATRA